MPPPDGAAPALVDTTLGVLGDGVVALAPIILPFLAPDLVRVVDAALALEALYPQMQEALAQTNQWANTQIGRAPGMLDGLVRALAPAWFADSVWPILRDVGAFLGGMLIEVVVELVRDFLIPSWGIYREDLPALWKGMVRAKDSIIAWDPLAFSLALTDIEIAVLSAAGRIEWSLGCWLLVIGALSGLAGGAIGGGAAATVSGGTATPVGATVAGTATTVTIGGTAYSIGEATGLILAGASLFTDLGRFVLTLFAYLDDDQPPEERQRLLNDLVATGFRIVIVVLMLGLAFAASRVGKAAGKAAEVAMQQTALKQAAAELDDLVRQIRAGAPLELPLSTPAIEMDHSPAHASLAPVLDLFRKHLEIDGTPQYLGSRVSISDDASFERYIAADMLLQDPGLSTEAALQYSRRVAGFYSRDNHRIMLRTGLRPEDVPGILAHETTHFVSRGWLFDAENIGLNEGIAQTVAKHLIPSTPDAYVELVELLAPLVERVGLDPVVRVTTRQGRDDFVRLVDGAFEPGAGEALLKRLQQSHAGAPSTSVSPTKTPGPPKSIQDELTGDDLLSPPPQDTTVQPPQKITTANARAIPRAARRSSSSKQVLNSWNDPDLVAAFKHGREFEKKRKIVHNVVPLQGIAYTGHRLPMSEVDTLVAFVRQHMTINNAQLSANDELRLSQALSRPIIAIKGTPLLRNFDYLKKFVADFGSALGKVHHWTPLYLGGDHMILIDLPEAPHNELHRRLEGIKFPGGGATMHPSSLYQRLKSDLVPGKAILYTDGTIKLESLEKFPASGTTVFPINQRWNEIGGGIDDTAGPMIFPYYPEFMKKYFPVK